MPNTSDVDIKVVIERVSNLADNYEQLRDLIMRQNDAMKEMTEVRAEVRAMNRHTEQLCSTLKSHTDAIADHSQRLQAHSTIWKLFGAVVLACTGLVGWGYSTLQTLKEADYSAEKRILALEYELGTMKNVSHETLHKY